MSEATDKLALEARRRALEGVEVAVAFMDAGQELAIPVKWGGMWHRFEDIPHIELINPGSRPQ